MWRTRGEDGLANECRWTTSWFGRERSCLLTIPCLSLFSSTPFRETGVVVTVGQKATANNEDGNDPRHRYRKKKVWRTLRDRRWKCNLGDFDATNIEVSFKRICIGIVIRIMFHGKRILLEPDRIPWNHDFRMRMKFWNEVLNRILFLYIFFLIYFKKNWNEFCNLIVAEWESKNILWIFICKDCSFIPNNRNAH